MVDIAMPGNNNPGMQGRPGQEMDPTVLWPGSRPSTVNNPEQPGLPEQNPWQGIGSRPGMSGLPEQRPWEGTGMPDMPGKSNSNPWPQRGNKPGIIGINDQNPWLGKGNRPGMQGSQDGGNMPEVSDILYLILMSPKNIFFLCQEWRPTRNSRIKALEVAK